MMYFADRISDNIRKREPEGYLICVNVPIARSGTQQYLQDEIGGNGDRPVTVYRPEDEVFSTATMASFEGMPVTNDHPDADEGVTVDNVQYLAKGHCQNIRRGTGSDRDLLLADLIITDPQLISDIMNGKREISCGYNYELHEEDGKMVQRQIRGNHIAVVDKGRAGHRVCIKDSAPNKERSKKNMDKPSIRRVFAKMLAHYAKDADPDELEQAVDAVEEVTADPPAPPTQPTEPPASEVPMNDADEGMAAIMARLDAIEKKLGIGQTDEAPEEAPAEDPLARLEKDLDEMEAQNAPKQEEPMAPDEDPEMAESQFVDPAQINEQDEDEIVTEEVEELPTEDCGPGKDCGPKKASDTARVALNAIKPIIAALPPSQRRKAADAAVAQIRKSCGMDAKPGTNQYLALKRKKAADSAKKNYAEIGEKIMASRNAQLRNKN